MKDLLICIAHHHSPERMQYLHAVIDAFEREYECALSLDMVIDTNVATLPDIRDGENITICSHVSLEHPFHLTWMHRRHIKERINDYRCFAYFEDDIYLPFENFLNYERNWDMLWPQYVPGFIRVEKHNGEEWVVDVTQPQPLQPRIPHFVALHQPYHGFWIMPQRALKETMTPNFARLSDSREVAASYPIADLNKTALVQIDGDHVVRKCFAWHLANNYAPCPTSPHGKIRVSEIFA